MLLGIEQAPQLLEFFRVVEPEPLMLDAERDVHDAGDERCRMLATGEATQNRVGVETGSGGHELNIDSGARGHPQIFGTG